jgi:hypothetical protein
MKKSLAEYMDDKSDKDEHSDKDDEEGEDIGDLHALNLFEKALGGGGYGDSTTVERFQAFKKLLLACKS